MHPFFAPVLHHCRNSSSSAREGAKNKALGCVAGVADLALFLPSGGYHGLFIELKSEKGVLSPDQKNWRHEILNQGYQYVVVRSLDEFISVIKDYLCS